MKRALAGLLMLICLALAAVAQQSPPSSDVPSHEDVMKFLDLIQVRARLVQLTAGMKESMKAGAEAGLKQKIPNPTPEQLRSLDAMLDPIFEDYPTDEMINAMVPIYQSHLTKEDLDGIISFYSSPVGQKLLKEQPAMMAEAMKAGRDVMMRRVPELTKRIDAAVDHLAHQRSMEDPKAESPSDKK